MRGGTCSFAGPAGATRITFRKVRWTVDTTVSGHAVWNQNAGLIRAWLTVTGPGGKATIRLSYHDYVPYPDADVSGSYRGRPLEAVLPAP